MMQTDTVTKLGKVYGAEELTCIMFSVEQSVFIGNTFAMYMYHKK